MLANLPFAPAFVRYIPEAVVCFCWISALIVFAWWPGHRGGWFLCACNKHGIGLHCGSDLDSMVSALLRVAGLLVLKIYLPGNLLGAWRVAHHLLLHRVNNLRHPAMPPLRNPLLAPLVEPLQ